MEITPISRKCSKSNIPDNPYSIEMLFWFFRLERAQGVKGFTKAITGTLSQWGHFIRKVKHPQVPSMLIFIHGSLTTQDNISAFLPRHLSPDISSIWTFLAQKSSYDSSLSLWEHQWNADSLDNKPSLTALHELAHPSNPTDYCCGSAFLKALMVWNFIIQSFVYIQGGPKVGLQYSLFTFCDIDY